MTAPNTSDVVHAINSGMHFAARLIKERMVASSQTVEAPVPSTPSWAICHETPGIPLTRIIPEGGSTVRAHATATDNRSGVALKKLQMRDVSGITYLHPGVEDECEMALVQRGTVIRVSGTNAYNYSHKTRYKFLNANGDLDGQWLFTYTSSWEAGLPVPPTYRMHITEEVAPASGGVLAWDDYGVIPDGASNFKLLELSAPLPNYRHVTQLYPGRYHRALSMWAQEFSMWGEGKLMKDKLQGMRNFASHFRIDGNVSQPDHFMDILDPFWGWHYDLFRDRFPDSEWIWVLNPRAMYDAFIVNNLPRGLAHYPYKSRASIAAYRDPYLVGAWHYSPMRKALTACDLLNQKGEEGIGEAYALLNECDFQVGEGITRTVSVNGLIPTSVQAYKTVWLACFGIAACTLYTYARKTGARQSVVDAAKRWAEGVAEILLKIQIDDNGKYTDSDEGDGLGEVYRPEQSGGFLGSYIIENEKYKFRSWTSRWLDALEVLGGLLDRLPFISVSQGPGPHLMQSPAGYETTVWSIKALRMYLSEVVGDRPTLTTTSTSATSTDAPTADAGSNQFVDRSALVTLDGSESSGSDDEMLTYLWEQMVGPTVTLSSTTVASPTFTAPSNPTPLVFRLTVSNSGGTDTAIVVVYVANRPPVADAGSGQTVAPGAMVTLDGSGSSDPDTGDTLSYLWEQAPGVGGSGITLSDATAVSPTFTAPTGPAALTFKLTVTDSQGASASDTVAITVQAPDDTN